MLNFTDIDFNAVWQETFGWNAAGDTDNRKFNDQAENDFWVRLAPRYTQEYNLNHDTGLIADKLAGFWAGIKPSWKWAAAAVISLC